MDLFGEAVGEDHIQVFVENSDVAEAECEVDALAKLNQVNDSQEHGVKAVGDDVLTQKTGSSNWHWVAVDHSKSFLENSVLTLSRQDLLFIVVPLKMGDQLCISNEAWSKQRKILINICEYLGVTLPNFVDVFPVKAGFLQITGGVH